MVIAPVMAPPLLGSAALAVVLAVVAVVVVEVNIASLVAISTPSKVLLVVIAPVIAPPALGKAALAVVVVDVKIASLVAISIPSTVPDTTKSPVEVNCGTVRLPVIVSPVILTKPVPVSSAAFNSPYVIFLV